MNEPAVFDIPLDARSQDEVVHLDSDCDEMPRYVGSIIFNDTSF